MATNSSCRILVLNPAVPLIEEIEAVIGGIDEGSEPLATTIFVLVLVLVVVLESVSLSQRVERTTALRGAALVRGMETLQLSSQRCCDQNPR